MLETFTQTKTIMTCEGSLLLTLDEIGLGLRLGLGRHDKMCGLNHTYQGHYFF